MALKPAPAKKEEDKIESIINKGGKVAEESKEEDTSKDKWTMITVRLPKWMIKLINEETEKRPGLSRNAWILESFQEKIKKESHENGLV